WRVAMSTQAQQGRKRRKPKVAPRYSSGDGHEMDERATAMNDDGVEIVRDVFTTATCRCFVLKSFSDANFHKSVKYGIWSSTYAHNALLDQAFKSDLSSVRPVLFFFSVCDTRHVSGIARMTSAVRTDKKFMMWEKTKYEGFFHVEWLMVKDVPNHVLTGIKMSNTPTKKSITSCRDCEEIPYDESTHPVRLVHIFQASQFISIFTQYPSRTSAWDDFAHFDALEPALAAKRGIVHSGSTELEAYLADQSNKCRKKPGALSNCDLWGKQWPLSLRPNQHLPASAETMPHAHFTALSTPMEDEERSNEGSDPQMDHRDLESATQAANGAPVNAQSNLAKHVPVIIGVAIGAYFGVGTRVLLAEFWKELSTQQVELLRLLGFGYFLPNAVGSFVMGMAARWKPVLRAQYMVVLTGVTTGFCGSCTTFASWDLGIAAMYVHSMWLNATLGIFIQVATAFVSFRSGYHAGEAVLVFLATRSYPFSKPIVDVGRLKLNLRRHIDKFEATKSTSYRIELTQQVQATEEALTACDDACTSLMNHVAQEEQALFPVAHSAMHWVIGGTVLTVLFWVLAFVGFSNYVSSRLLAVCFGPFGALLRYYLSLFNAQPSCKSFPKYTFIPNVSASVLSCVMLIIGSCAKQHSSDAYRIYQLVGEGAIMVGFLGSLSTVSTWVNELDTLATQRFMWAYRYGAASIVVSQLASVCILGFFTAYSSTPLLM
ncbi:TPA: hypothetical protein N0F65_000613, partial [Lagenidium giganteum]